MIPQGKGEDGTGTQAGAPDREGGEEEAQASTDQQKDLLLHAKMIGELWGKYA